MFTQNLLILTILTFVINVPFGYLRARVKKFSVLWFVYIHAPVPFIIWLRKYYGIELSWGIIPLEFGAYFLGQFIGRKYREFKLKTEN